MYNTVNSLHECKLCQTQTVKFSDQTGLFFKNYYRLINLTFTV
jgi:hypothetical protein